MMETRLDPMLTDDVTDGLGRSANRALSAQGAVMLVVVGPVGLPRIPGTKRLSECAPYMLVGAAPLGPA